MIPSLVTDPAKLSFEMLFGYGRVSTDDQKLDLQHDALIHAGVERGRIFEDKLSGMRADRPGLASVLKAVREGDMLVIQTVDLERPMAHQDQHDDADGNVVPFRRELYFGPRQRQERR